MKCLLIVKIANDHYQKFFKTKKKKLFFKELYPKPLIIKIQ